MPENKPVENKKKLSVDWLMRGSLTKVGDIFDRLTGRGWKPTSSLATSELIERLKTLLDKEAKDLGKKGKFVPHNLKLKIQWDKFTLDSDEAMNKLQNELLTSIIDHINDNRYHTYAPMKLQVKPDYFTEGVKLSASFDKFSEEEGEAAVNVTMSDMKNIVIPTAPEIKIETEKEIVIVEFSLNGKPKKVELRFAAGARLSVGRTKENALVIEDTSISKIHATLFINNEKQITVADTGSTNGTFINEKRIGYGKAYPILDTDKLKFGTIEVALDYTPKEIEIIAEEPQSAVKTEQFVMTNDALEKTRQVEIPKPAMVTLKPIGSSVKAEDKTPQIELKPLAPPIEVKPEIEMSNEKTLTDLAETVLPKEKEVKENRGNTGQGIVFDFEEKK